MKMFGQKSDSAANPICRKLWPLGVGILSALVAVSCSSRGPADIGNQSYLIILVEKLGFDAVTCLLEDETRQTHSGFQELCQDSVRFTHAYTPSTMGLPNLASVLTAQYPAEHGVLHNGSKFLSGRARSIAEVAWERGYRTSFWGGGPPIWRRSGINQGFEVFEDSFTPALKKLYRPFSENVTAMLGWHDTEAVGGPFLAVMYVPDLQFVDAPAVAESAEIKESSYRSQIEDLDESLAQLFSEMKKRKVWDSTTIVLAGLSSQRADLSGEVPPGLNLLSEMTRVAQFVKPARRVRDRGMSWKIDGNVNLVDLGTTLFDFFREKLEPSVDSQVASISLRESLHDPSAKLDKQRWMTASSYWGVWRGWSDARFAIRSGPLLLVFDQPIHIYNTVADTLESAPLVLKDRYLEDRRILDFRNEASDYFNRMGIDPWNSLLRRQVEKFRLGQEIWRRKKTEEEVYQHVLLSVKNDPLDDELRNWAAWLSLHREDWASLLKLAQKPYPIQDWIYLASLHLGRKSDLPKDPCFVDFLNNLNPTTNSQLTECEGTALSELLMIRNPKLASAVRSKATETFTKWIQDRILQQRLRQLNYANGLTWDLEPKQGRIDATDLILAHPDVAKLRATGSGGRKLWEYE